MPPRASPASLLSRLFNISYRRLNGGVTTMKRALSIFAAGKERQKMRNYGKMFAALALLLTVTTAAFCADIRGRVVDKATREALIGATIQLADGRGVVTDIDGNFVISGLERKRKYTLTVKYVSYKTVETGGIQPQSQSSRDTLVVEMVPDEQQLGEVTVTGMTRRATEAAMIMEAKKSEMIVSNISAQEIKRTQDNNASEVIRRVPGVSLIDDKFVMVRGLSQRYNNVWINGGAVPSSEADSRAFSFDIIPSGQIDNLVIVKSPAPEYPADFSGGFIQINTKDIPSENRFSVTVGGNWNDATSFSNFLYGKGSATDFLGFDNGMRSLQGGIGGSLRALSAEKSVDLLNNGFNNDWRVKSMKPAGDLKLGAEFAHRWTLGGHKLGMIGAVNYTNEYRAYTGMQNNLFDVYDVTHDQSNYLRHSVDDQYNNNVRLGALLNFTLLSKGGNSRYELKNIFNQLATDRYTWRTGFNAQSDNEQSAEYYYRSRTTYNVQLTGRHTLASDKLEWGGSYSFANRNLPDRRRYRIDDSQSSDGTMQLAAGNDINREYTKLNEHIFSANVNDAHTFAFGSFEPTLKVGAYGEYRTRDYTTRDLFYNWEPSNTPLLPSNFRDMDMQELLSSTQCFGEGGLYLLEDPHRRNDYSGNNTLGAGFAAASLPLGKLSIYAGVRFEYNQMELISNMRDDIVSHKSTFYRNSDLFPSLNTTYRFNDAHQLRLSYGKSVNRPEFREVSPSVYYDFDLASSVMGNASLKPCYIHNIDLRYEFYPSRGEQITIAGFFKRFDNPIEWTYTVSGGTDLIYSYENAKSANNVGLELDVRKTLDFIGLPGFSLSFNGALIHSRVKFDDGSRHKDRAMQGQSPYLINGGLFYTNDKAKLNVALLYNRIGKRLIGVGRSEGSTGSDDNARVPDSYEMPRNSLDLSISKKFFDGHLELKANVRDILGEKVCYKQFADVYYSDGSYREVEQTTREYKPGRNFGLSATYQF